MNHHLPFFVLIQLIEWTISSQELSQQQGPQL